jgi:catechol 2,3-dioxygenase-like lactoylglutathione lyase family enzyme
MLGSSPVVAFVATTRPDEARTFYRDTLGLGLTSEDQFALVFDAGGTILRVTRVEQLQPGAHTVLGWLVNDVVIAVRALALRGVAFERYPSMEQDEDGIWTSPGGARIGWFKDPDGNTLSVTQLAA